ncbi:unnamed protein product [Cuscuta epithymum]|uniref:Transcription repressor n=1 Tax=Cuscuta epithymum TaxID=186058 RepID=A0AAV0FGG1_9ASTE|nr:unnamed protein product [Cuscuta epithymum]
MGIQRFRLSDMIPNALFYKLRNLGKKNRASNLNNNKEPLSTSSYLTAAKATSQPQRKSYHFPREHQNSPPPPPPHYIYLEPPRKSSKKRRSSYRRSSSRTSTPRLPPSSSGSGICSCRPSTDSAWTNKQDSTPEYFPDSPLDSTSSSSSGKDSILPELVSRPVLSAAAPGKFAGKLHYDDDHDRFETGPKIELPRIITKPIVKNSDESARIKGGPNQPCKCGGNSDEKKVKKKKACCGGPVHRISGNSPAGMKLRTNSPRIGRIQGRRSVSSRKNILPESFAVVKTSQDPQRDFRESMVEMIVENNIRTSSDLENLLACFLSMNSDEYHDMIIKVFKQIWFDIANVRLN